MAAGELRIGSHRIVRIDGDGVSGPRTVGDRTGIDGVSARPVTVPYFCKQAIGERPLQRSSDIP